MTPTSDVPTLEGGPVSQAAYAYLKVDEPVAASALPVVL